METGFVVVEKVGGKSAVTRCFSKYPLKLIVPRKAGSFDVDAVWIYSLSYGGGIVSMSKEGEEVFLGDFTWDPQEWGFPNSDNSGGGDPYASDKKLESKAMINLEKGKRQSNGALKTSSPKGEGCGVPSETKEGTEQDHEKHKWAERERRKKMKEMFSNLHALLPQLPHKADKCTIIDEAATYIKSLQQTLQELHKQKLQRIREKQTPTFVGMVQARGSNSREAFLVEEGKNWSTSSSSMALANPLFPPRFKTWLSPNVVLNVMGEDAYINICSVKKPGLISNIFYVMDKHKLEVVTAQVSSDYFRSMYMIHVRAIGVSNQFPEALMIEKLYKLAAEELLLWLSW